MSFKTTPGERLRGFARYLPDERSIIFVRDQTDTEPIGLDRTSLDGALEFGTLTLMARTLDGRVLFPEGYHPRESWTEGTVPVPTFVSGSLYWEPAEDLIRGGALSVAEVIDIVTTFDPSTGWIVIRLRAEDAKVDDRLDAVEFCDGVIAGVHGPRLVALWIRLR